MESKLQRKDYDIVQIKQNLKDVQEQNEISKAEAENRLFKSSSQIVKLQEKICNLSQTNDYHIDKINNLEKEVLQAKKEVEYYKYKV